MQRTNFYTNVLLACCWIRSGNPFALCQTLVLAGQPDNFTRMVLKLGDYPIICVNLLRGVE